MYEEADQSIENVASDRFGLTRLSARIKNITETNLTTIYQKKISDAIATNTNTLTDQSIVQTSI